MTFCLETLERLTAQYGHVVRVVISCVGGSSPREVGASLWVHKAGEEGTIGGGAMEYAALQQARKMLCGDKKMHQQHFALGPSLGQCCGGSVTLLFERFMPEHVSALSTRQSIARDLETGEMMADFTPQEGMILPSLMGNIFAEQIKQPKRILWLYGAGHVGRALVHHLAPQEDLTIYWWDSARERFPTIIPDGVNIMANSYPTEMLRFAPDHAEHLVMTYSHAVDLKICHAVLSREFASLGVIGSKTKRARFRKRLQDWGIPAARLSRLECPIGDRDFGKSPHALALGVVFHLLHPQTAKAVIPKRRAS